MQLHGAGALLLALIAALTVRAVFALDPLALYHQTAADMAVASTFVERSAITEQTARLVITRTVIAEYDQQGGRTRIHAYELRRQRDARGVWQTKERYLDLIFLGARSYVRTTPGINWRPLNGARYTDTTWRDEYSGAAPALEALPARSLRLAGSARGRVQLLVWTPGLTADLWIATGSTPYLMRYTARYRRTFAGASAQVSEDSRFYGFDRPLRIVAPIR